MGILTENVNPREIYIHAMEKSDENTHKDDISLVVIHGLSAESV
jgi:hypothetical protein